MLPRLRFAGHRETERDGREVRDATGKNLRNAMGEKPGIEIGVKVAEPKWKRTANLPDAKNWPFTSQITTGSLTLCFISNSLA